MNALIGMVFESVESTSDEVLFRGAKSFRLHHEQDCCESVSVEDVCGDLSDLTGVPILFAEESSDEKPTQDGDERWTFYTLRTIKGTVTVRFYGTSNGHYSTAVNLSRMSGDASWPDPSQSTPKSARRRREES